MKSGAESLLALLTAANALSKPARYTWFLKTIDTPSLRLAVGADGKLFLWKACLSFADALGTIDKGSKSWAVVKLYYCVFYALKAWLASADELHIYLGHSPHSLLIRNGEKLLKGEGNSHSYLFGRFAERFPSLPILSQQIQADEPLEWLTDMREQQQYRTVGCTDPAQGSLFQKWSKANSEQLFQFYTGVSDTSQEYATLFDPDHAMLAWPARLLCDVLSEFRVADGFQLSQTQLALARSLCKTKGRPLGAYMKMLSTPP